MIIFNNFIKNPDHVEVFCFFILLFQLFEGGEGAVFVYGFYCLSRKCETKVFFEFWYIDFFF